MLDKGISERELAGDERPWTTLQNIRQVKSYRFLLTLNNDNDRLTAFDPGQPG